MPKEPTETREQKILRQYRQEKPGHMMAEEVEELLRVEHGNSEEITVKGKSLVTGDPITLDTTRGEWEAAEMWHVWRRDRYILGKIEDPFAHGKRLPLAELE